MNNDSHYHIDTLVCFSQRQATIFLENTLSCFNIINSSFKFQNWPFKNLETWNIKSIKRYTIRVTEFNEKKKFFLIIKSGTDTMPFVLWMLTLWNHVPHRFSLNFFQNSNWKIINLNNIFEEFYQSKFTSNITERFT